MPDGPALAHTDLTLTLIRVSVAVINISLSDLLNAPETTPVAPTRSGDAAAFTGLLDQFDRHQAEAAAKPARPRAERATAAAQDDEAAKTPRSKAPVAAKVKPAATVEREAVPTREDVASAPTSSKDNADTEAARDAAPSDTTADASDQQTVEVLALQTPAPVVVVVEDKPAPQPSSNLQAAGTDDALAGVAAASADLAADSNAQTDAVDPLAGALSEKTDQKTKAPAPHMQTTDGGTVAADDVPVVQPTQTASSAANAQAADMSKRLETLPMQVAVQLSSEEAPKPLKAPVSLANGMSHPAHSEAATTTQTAAAAPATDSIAAPTTATIDTPDVQPAAQSLTQSATPAFAALVETANDKSLPAAGKATAGEAPTIGSVAVSGSATTANAAQSAAQAAKPAPLPHPATEQVAVHIAKASADGVDKINVKLKPASLGHVDVQLDIAADGRVQVVVSADRADTLDLLQRDARGLERALNDAGLQMDQQSMSFNLRDQGLSQGNAGDETTGRAGWQGGTEGADEPVPAIGGYLNARAAVGGVDIRV